MYAPLQNAYKPAREIAAGIAAILFCYPYTMVCHWYISMWPTALVFCLMCDFFDECDRIKIPTPRGPFPQPEETCIVMNMPSGKAVIVSERDFVDNEVLKLIEIREERNRVETFDYMYALRELIWRNHGLIQRYRHDVRILMPSYAFDFIRRAEMMKYHYPMEMFKEFEGIKISFEGYERKIILYHVDCAGLKQPWMINEIALP